MTATHLGLRPRVLITEPGGPKVHTVVLVLPGGRARSMARARAWHVARLRMIPIAWAARRGTGGVAVWRLLYRLRGWNEPWLDPVQDTRWALAEARDRHPGARVILVGHSMGGRAALRCADTPTVAGVCALAPWIEDGEPIEHLAGSNLVIAHGGTDRITDPIRSADFAARAAILGASVRFQPMPGGHAMVRDYAGWHALVRDFVASILAAPGGDLS